jgi:hypothetical protein
MSTDAALTELLAERDIRAVLTRYVHGIDTKDWELVRSCYHPDARDHRAGRFDGGVDEFIPWVGKFLSHFTVTQHALTTNRIELDGDVARSETYVTALHFREQAPMHVLTVATRVQDRFERREEVWRIADRSLTYDFSEDRPVSSYPPPGFGPAAGSGESE